MFKKLQEKWKVSPGRMGLILVTFAVGGSLCGWLGKKFMNLLNLENGPLWILLYILVVTLLWPFCVLAVSLVTGQFRFFRAYISKMLTRMRVKKKQE